MTALFSRKKKNDETQKSTEKDAPAKQQKPKKAAAKKSRGQTEGIAYRVLVQPHVTEKAGRLQGMNQYVFRVHPRAGKQEIAQAVQERFGVRPTRVNTVKIAGKTRRLGRTEGRVAGYKKAVVTLPEGKTIDIVGQ